MSSSLDARIAELALRQHGAFNRGQLYLLGASRQAMRTRLEQGRWERVHPGVFHLAGAPRTWESDLMAACLTHASALASHRSGGWLWRLDGSFRQRPEISVPRGVRLRLQGVTVHESLDLHLCAPDRKLGIPVTGLLRTVLDLGAVLGPKRVAQTVDDVLRKDLVDLPDLWELYTRHRRRGRNGTGVLRAVLERAAIERSMPGSFFERLVYDLLVDAGLPAPNRQVEVRDGGGRAVAIVDLAYPDRRIAIELLGKEFHFTERAFERDPDRRNRLQLLGWTVLEFTWRRYVDEPNTLIRDVADALHR